MKISISEKTLFPSLGGMVSLLCSSFLKKSVIVWTLLVVFSVILLSFVLQKKIKHLRIKSAQRIWNMVAIAVGVLVVSLSIEITSFIDQSYSPGMNPRDIRVAIIVLTEDPIIVIGGRWRAVGRILSTENKNLTVGARGRIAVIGSGKPKNINSGSIVKVSGVLKISTEDDSLVFYSRKWTLEGWRGIIWELRHSFIRRLEERLDRNNANTATFFDALLLGRKTDPGLPLFSKIRDAGAMHLLALSGFHLGIIAIFVRILFKPLTGIRTSSFVSVLVIFGYLFVTGIKPSLLRAVVMYTFWTWDKLKGYRVSAHGYLYTAFLFQLIFFPRSATTLSFQLSYAALFGLITIGMGLRQFFSRWFPIGLSFALSSSLTAQISTLPFVVSAFGIWRPAGLVSSLFLTPLVTFAMVSGSAGILISGEARWFLSIQENLISLIGQMASLFSQIPGVAISKSFAWLLTAFGFTMTIILVESSKRKIWGRVEPQLPLLHTDIFGIKKSSSPQEVGSEFSCKQGRKRKNN